MGEVKEKSNPSTQNDEYDYKGYVIGSRFGWAWRGKALGLEFAQSTSKWDLTEPDSVKDTLTAAGDSLTDEWTAKHYGLFLASRFQDFLFHGAILYSDYEDTNDNSLMPKRARLTGHTYVLGGGYIFGDLVKVGFEWRGATLTHYEDQSANEGYSLPNPTIGMGKYRTKEYYIGISMPMEWGGNDIAD